MAYSCTLKTLAAVLLAVAAISIECAKACHPAFIDAVLPNQDMRCDIRPPAEHEGPACRMATEPDFYFDRETKACVNAPWSECMPRGEGKGFPSLQLCEDSCPVKPQIAHKVEATGAVLPNQNMSCDIPPPRVEERRPGCLIRVEPDYYFDRETNNCVNAPWSNCLPQGEAKGFPSYQLCKNVCPVKEISKRRIPNNPVCQLPSDPSQCLAYIERFYYNTNSAQCEMFVYGGCGGNRNNFKSKEDCEKTCLNNHEYIPWDDVDERTPEVHFCQLAKETGPCEAALRRYYFNVEMNDCEEFIFGGCEGNANNFISLQDCKQACPGLTPASIALLKQDVRCDIPPPLEEERRPGCLISMRPDYYFDREIKQCVNAPWSNCLWQGAPTGFQSYQLCKDSCQDSVKTEKRSRNPICLLPKARSNCLAYMEHFYYNKDSAQCEVFIFGGCGRGGNNFKSKEQCEKTCFNGNEHYERTPAVHFCQLPKETGPCKATFRRYYFNAETNGCEEFIYGGCEGNVNNFRSLQGCEQACSNLIRRDPAAIDVRCDIRPPIVKENRSQCIFKDEPYYYYDREINNCVNPPWSNCLPQDGAKGFPSYRLCRDSCQIQERI